MPQQLAEPHKGKQLTDQHGHGKQATVLAWDQPKHTIKCYKPRPAPVKKYPAPPKKHHHPKNHWWQGWW